MRYFSQTQSSQNGPMDAYGQKHVIRDSSERKGVELVASATPTHANKKSSSLAEEERQDVSMRNKEGQQKSQDDLEYEILCKEIDRIGKKFQSGAHESEEKVSLTSTFSKDAEISQTMHEKLMRLIKAMIPNSTTEQKDSFIRDLFEMGLRVSLNSSNRSQIEQVLSVEKQAQPYVDELMIEEPNSILDSSNEDSSRQKLSPYLDQGLKNTPSLDDYIDGANSILASIDELDAPGVEIATSIHQSVSSRRNISSQATNSSDAVDIRWEQLRDKMLNDSCSGRTQNSLTSEMEANLIQECVETGLTTYQETCMLSNNRPDKLQKEMSHGCSSVDNITDDVHQNPDQGVGMTKNLQRRPGQADDSSTRQPMQQRNVSSDSLSIDTISNSIVPTFDEDPIQENNRKLLKDTNFANLEHMVLSRNSKKIEGGTRKEEKVGCDESQQMHEITLHPSLKDELKIKVSESGPSDTQYSRSNRDTTTSDSNTAVMQNQSIDGSSRHVAKVIDPKIARGESISDINTVEHNQSLEDDSSHDTAKIKGVYHSFYQSVNLSASGIFETNDNAESPDSATEVLPSWRLSPDKSLSDFMLTVLSSETGTSTNYYVHKHMMAAGPRSSQYMNEVFASENASHFQVTLDGKTFPLIPDILDFMYCHDHDIRMTTDNAISFRQLAKMLKISLLEVKVANFILEDMEIDKLMTYVSDCTYFNDTEVTKAVVKMCTRNIESISVDDRLWMVMDPELFLQIISSPHVDRGVLSKHLSILLREYLDLHQHEITGDLFVTLTSENVIPIVDCSAALPLIELSNCYNSEECEELQKRCAFTIACSWQTTPQTERQKLFALLRHLPSSITVDFLEIVESGKSTLEILRSEMEQQTISGNKYVALKQEPLTVQDFCGDLVDDNHSNEKLSWKMDPEKSYSDMSIRIDYLNHKGSEIYHVHKQIVAVGPKRSNFLAQHLHSREVEAGEKVSIVIKLDYEGSSVVPQILDFMYLQDTKLEFSNENSVALHYVSRVFEISRLSREIVKFINHDLSLSNIADYIINGVYYRDHLTIAMAGRLCAQEIMSIDVDSDLLTKLESDFFEKVVSCNIIEKSARPHVNVLITKYFSVHDLQGDVIEKLLKSIHVDEIDKNSALDLLKIVIKLKAFEGIGTFENVKKKSIDVITENWTELTSYDHCRREIFSIIPSFPSDLIARMLDTVDSKAKQEQRGNASKQAILEKLCQEKVNEANRLREEEVSSLKKKLEKQTTTMIALQMELEEKLAQVDRVLVRPTASNGSSIPKSPTRRKTSHFIPVTSPSDEYGPPHELEGTWYNNIQDGGNDEEGKMDIDGMEMITDVFQSSEALDKISEGSEPNDCSNHYKRQEDTISDQQSVSTAHVQKKKGRRCC